MQYFPRSQNDVAVLKIKLAYCTKKHTHHMNFIQILIYDYGISTMKNIKTLVFLPIPIYHIYYS